jgi:hypothetical protein
MSTTTQVRVNRRLAIKIARDVLEQLRLNRFKARQGSYCQIATGQTDVYGDSQYINQYSSAELRRPSFKAEFKKNKALTCEVCALGALFTSFVHINNVFTVGQVVQPKFSRMFDALEGAFTVRELLLMEYVFEEGECGVLGGKVTSPYYEEYEEATARFRGQRLTFTRQELLRAIKYGERYSGQDSSDQRLRLIMLNVLRNKGRFVVPE